MKKRRRKKVDGTNIYGQPNINLVTKWERSKLTIKHQILTNKHSRVIWILFCLSSSVSQWLRHKYMEKYCKIKENNCFISSKLRTNIYINTMTQYLEYFSWVCMDKYSWISNDDNKYRVLILEFAWKKKTLNSTFFLFHEKNK